MSREVDIVDLIKRIVNKWIFVCVALLIGALVANFIAILQTIKARDNAINEMSDTTKIVEEYKDVLSSEEIKEVELGVQTYIENMECYTEVIQYNDESILCNLDPDAVPTVRLQYYVDTNYVVEYPVIEKEDSYASIISAYENAILTIDTKIYSELAKDIGVDEPRYVKELIEAYRDDRNLVINICADSEDNVNIIANRLNEYIDELTPELQKIYGYYDINLVDNSFYIDVNSDLLSFRQNQLGMINSLRSSRSSISASYSDEQKEYYKYLLESIDGSDVTEDEKKSIDYINIKEIIVGAILGVMFACLWIMFRYIASNTIKIATELESEYEMNLLGVIPSSNNKFVNKKGPQFTEDERISMICASIRILAKKNELKTIYLTGSCNDEQTERIKGLVLTRLKDKNIEAKLGTTVIYDPESLEDMCSSDGVVFIERVDYSLYSDIKKEIELCDKFEVKIIGAVGID